MATVITNLLSAIPFIGNDIVPLIYLILSLYSSYMLIMYILYISQNINEDNPSLYKEDISPLGINNYTEKDILSTFVGFIDGDGYFRISKKNKIYNNKIIDYIYISLVINLSIKDKDLLEYFNKNLSLGNLYKITTKNNKQLIRLEINKTEIINKLIPLLNKYNIQFLTNTRQRQYLLIKYINNNNLIKYNEIIINKLFIDKYIDENIIEDNFNNYINYFNN